MIYYHKHIMVFLSYEACLFVLVLYIPANNFSVFLGLTSTKQRVKCLAQGHDNEPLVSLKLGTLRSQVLLSTTEPLHSSYDVTSGSNIITCIKMNKPLFNYL